MATRGGRTQVRTQARVESSDKPTGDVFCTGHKRRATCFQAHTPANKGRWFYSCPLGKDDADRCRFFQWADGNSSSNPKPTPNSTPGRSSTGGNVLGSSPGGRSMPMTPTSRASAIVQAVNARNVKLSKEEIRSPINHQPRFGISPRGPMADDPIVEVPDSDDEIDWEEVDTDAIEKDAEARATPTATPRAVAAPVAAPMGREFSDEVMAEVRELLRKEREAVVSSEGDGNERGKGEGGGLTERLSAVSETGEGGHKRRRVESEDADEGEERTPKRGVGNPFLTTPGTGRSAASSTAFETPAEGRHPALGPLLLAIPEVNEHLLRADRRVRAAETMKKSMRTTIKNLQDRVKELEEELARRG